MIRSIERGIARYEAALDILIVGGWQVFVAVAVLVVMAGQCRARFFSSSEKKETPLEVNRFDISNPKHRQLGEALLRVAESANPDLANSLEVGVVPSQDINAVSMGDGRFVLWEGLGALPQSAVDAILAHEVAHDLLLHSRRAADLSEFTAFWTDMMGTVAQADFATSDVITGWGQGAVMPRYSRSQEREADTFAITLLGDLGYEKAGGVFADALQLLLDRYGDTGGAFGDSHPATSERISAARARQTVRSERRSR